MAEQTTRKAPESITCSGCDARWTALGAAHCPDCHRLFATPGLFDLHRQATRDGGRCLNPTQVTHNDRRQLFYRGGMWRGPELSTEARKRLQAGRR